MTELYDKMTIAFNSDIMPQNGFLKNGVRYGFAAVAASVKNRCPGDYSYFKGIGCYEVPVSHPFVRWIDNAEDAKKDRESRVIPFKMTLEHLDKLPVITVRRKNKAVSVIERQKALARGTEDPAGDGVEIHMPPFMMRPEGAAAGRPDMAPVH